MSSLFLIQKDLDNYDYNDDDEYRKIGSIKTLFKEFDRNYYKPITTDGGFAERNKNYIEYTSKGDKYENLSPKEYLCFEETRTICRKSEPVEIFMGSGTGNVIDTIFNTVLQRFQCEFIPDSVELLYYHFQRIDNRRAES